MITERRVPELILVIGSQPAVDVSHKPGGRLPLLLPGLQLPPQPLRGLRLRLLLKTVTRQRHGCDLNPGPSALESSMLTTRLPSHPLLTYHCHFLIYMQTCQIFTSMLFIAVIMFSCFSVSQEEDEWPKIGL